MAEVKVPLKVGGRSLLPPWDGSFGKWSLSTEGLNGARAQQIFFWQQLGRKTLQMARWHKADGKIAQAAQLPTRGGVEHWQWMVPVNEEVVRKVG